VYTPPNICLYAPPPFQIARTNPVCDCFSNDVMLCLIDRTTGDDEDEFSKVETEAVPSEVRDWLALTFTRSTSSSVAAKRRDNDSKPKFRSVANAIRAGILVDRLGRRH